MCFVLSSVDIFLSFLFFPFSFQRAVGSLMYFLLLGAFLSCWTGSMSCVYVYMWEFCVLSGPIYLSLCVCMRMCQRLYEMCTLLSLVSLPGPQSVFLSVLFHTLFNFTTLSPFYHLIPRILCLGSPFFGTEPPFPDMSNIHLYSVG